MNLQIDLPYIESMIAVFMRLARLQEQLHFGSKVTMPFNQLSVVAKEKLAKDEPLTKGETLLWVLWEAAENKAFHTLTLNWMVRGDADIWLAASHGAQ